MASAGGIGQGLAAAVNGFMRGRQMAQDWDSDEKEREWKEQQRDRQRKEWKSADDEESMLKDAAAPVAEQGVYKGANADEVTAALKDGPVAEAPQVDLVAPLAYNVAGKEYASRGEAQTAAAAQNTPEAVAQRQQDGYAKLGKPKEAMALGLQRMNYDKALQEQADQKWRNDLGQAMASGHEGMAKLAGLSKFGPLAGQNVSVASAGDGKVQYVVKDADGNATPLLQPFDNSPEGVMRVAVMLDHTIKPADRLRQFVDEQQSTRAYDIQNKTLALSVRTADRADRSEARSDRTEERLGRLTDAQIDEYGRKRAHDAAEDRIPPGVKLSVQGWQKELDNINAAVTKSMADGSWSAESDSAKQLLSRQKKLSDQVGKAMLPYTMAPGAKGGDVMGVRAKMGGATPAGGSAVKASVTGGATGSGYNGGSAYKAAQETLFILRREREQPNQSAEGLAALDREIARAEKTLQANAPAGSAAPSSAPVQMAQAAATAPKPAQTSPAPKPSAPSAEQAAAPAPERKGVTPLGGFYGQSAAERSANVEKVRAAKEHEKALAKKEKELEEREARLKEQEANRKDRALGSYPNTATSRFGGNKA